jgi:hypothetical protein
MAEENATPVHELRLPVLLVAQFPLRQIRYPKSGEVSGFSIYTA